MRYLKIGIGILVAIIAVGCGTSASDLAKKDAQSMAYTVVNTRMLGDLANDQLIAIDNILKKNKLNFTDIGRSRSELLEVIKADYIHDAQTSYTNLTRMKANPTDAAAAQKDIAYFLRKANAGYDTIGSAVTIRTVSQHVARNSVEFAQQHGGAVTKEMLLSAGMSVPTITHTRTVIRRVAAKPVTRKAPAKKKPTRASVRAERTTP